MTKEIVINKFNGGMTSDPRGESSECQLCAHFDNFTRARSLVPYKNTAADFDDQATNTIRNFLYYTGDNNYIYGLGKVTGQAYAKIYSKNSIGGGAWVAETTGADSSGATSFNMFVEYKKIFYGAVPGTPGRIWSYEPATDTFTATAGSSGSINFTKVSQALVHSKDDILYVGLDNTIYYKNGAGNFTLGLTLPTGLIVASLSEYGNYLAIACRPTYGASTSSSKVFLWDRDATLITVSESIDWGTGDLLVLDSIDGYLIGVSVFQDAGTTNNAKLIFKKYGGGGAVQFKEVPFVFDASSYPDYLPKQKYNNRLYFALSNASDVGSTSHELTGVWSVGRNGEYEPFSVTIDRVANNGTETKTIAGFIIVQDYVYISYTTTADVYGLSKTSATTTYSAISTFRTVLNPGMPALDKIKRKQLKSAGLTFRYISGVTSPTVELQYAKDGGAFTSVYTHSTSTETQFNRTMDANASNFAEGREYEFKVISKGVEVTGIFYKYETLDEI